MNINQIDLVDECERGLLNVIEKPFWAFIKNVVSIKLAKPWARECFV